MPIFEYKCDKCEKVEDKLVRRSDDDANVEIVCGCDAGGKMHRTDCIGTTFVRFKGQWATTTGGY